MAASLEVALLTVYQQSLVENKKQNPDTKSRWAKMANDGRKVMQFLERGKYIAVVADGKVYLYPGKK